MGRRNSILALLAGLLLAAVLGGCSMRSADELYALPKQSDAYYDLQKAIDRVMTQNASYSGPLSGSNQQSVQLADLDGDGQDEAIVFARSSGEKPLKAYIFDRSGDHYENTAVMEGDGSAFDAVEYVQLDDQPGMEILVGRQLSDQILQSLCVYSYRDGQLVELMSANYSEFKVVDLDGDDHKDVFILRLETEERTGVAELYRYRNGAMERDQEAPLSTGAKQIKRILAGYVAQGVPAVFVASTYEEDTIITDIFAFYGKFFRNIAANGDAGVSAQTVRNYNVYATDIDEDGVIELPMPVALPSATAGEETYWVIDWYNLVPGGTRNVKLTTYHNYSGGWYLILPDKWSGQLSVSREKKVSEVPGLTFSKWNGYDQTPEEIMTIYAFTGDDRVKLAQADGRILLAEKGEVAYSAALGSCKWAAELSAEDLISMFHFIYLDWNSGET